METASLSEVEPNCYLWILADHRYINIVVQNVPIKNIMFYFWAKFVIQYRDFIVDNNVNC